MYWKRHKWQKIDSLFWTCWFNSKLSYQSYQQRVYKFLSLIRTFGKTNGTFNVWSFWINKVIVSTTEAKIKPKIISRSERCQPAGIKLQEIFILLTVYSWYHHTETTRSNIMYFYRDDPASASLGNGERVDDESSKTYIERRAYSQERDFPHTNSFMHFFP